MTRAPAVAWFRAHKGQDEWIPLAPQYRVLIAEGGAPDSLHGIATDALLAAAAELLHASQFAEPMRSARLGRFER